MYEVLIEAGAGRELRQLDEKALRRIAARIKALAANPRPAGCRKLAGGERDWRVRVGDFRVVYEIDDRAREVRVLRVRHRREAYT